MILKSFFLGFFYKPKIEHEKNNKIIVTYNFEYYYSLYKEMAFYKIQKDIFKYIHNPDIWEKIIKFVIFYPSGLDKEIKKIENDSELIIFTKNGFKDNDKKINYIFKYE